MDNVNFTHFENLRERFYDARILITIHLNDVDESDFGFWAIAERLDYGREFLYGSR